ncbi:ATP-grasp domain-containing protein [Paenibacillus sp. 481]|uniref:ATP-grasp domain-containing protein n=1 Tax=Paenibacillus sp. 481 TaxID=2835869 RepID=UPI001E3648A4|nr:sugar-transfer associated ATP-grasp domain-containing protein [Paenibacillus sp. 481]UHA72102.1 hypothetical protein KIK04_15480 [Paenibacillus sp. 481]
MRKRHILILGDVHSVSAYMDFFENEYSIITSEYEYRSMAAAIKYAVNVAYKLATPDVFDASCFEHRMDEVLAYAAQIVEQFGPLDCVVATHEHTVLPAAIIRTHFQIQGLQANEAYALRDKNKMKQKISEYGLPIPKFAHVEQHHYPQQIDDFLNQFDTIVIKPANQGGSQGVLVTSNKDKVQLHIEQLLQQTNNISLEQYINLPTMHIDGVMCKGDIHFLSVSSYVGSCYNFVHHRTNIGSVIHNDKQLYDRAKQYAEQCLAAFQIESLVFHLELFEQDLDNFIFLEMAGRYVGAGMTKLIDNVFGFDLVKASYDLDCLHPIDRNYSETMLATIKPSGVLLIPSPIKKSIRVKGISGLGELPHNVAASEFAGPGSTILFSNIESFKTLARITITDDTIASIKSTMAQLNDRVQFVYEEVQ